MDPISRLILFISSTQFGGLDEMQTIAECFGGELSELSPEAKALMRKHLEGYNWTTPRAKSSQSVAALLACRS